jgi:Asp-tRNA(Asn)/Glu-tRNA(Gln) amidotransferase A subunit family amidase
MRVTRRQFLASISAVAALSTEGCRRPVKEPAVENASELLELSAAEAVDRMKRGDLTAEHYAQTLLEQCERGKALNAFITLEPDRVLEAARAADRKRISGVPLGPLHGLPIPIKDSVNTKDYPTTGGTPALRHFHPKEDAAIVRKLVDAGAIIQGKTNLHELSFGWTSNNLAFGSVHNPYDRARIPGGSSGGTATAIAARMAPLGVAEDTEGSIRVPAAMCGVAGFRPTTGRYPSTGVVPISELFDQVGPQARTVNDLVLFDSVVTGDANAITLHTLTGVRIGVAREYWFKDLDPEVRRVTEDALRKLQRAGVELVEAEVEDVAKLRELTTWPIENHDVLPALRQYLKENQVGIGMEDLIAHASADIQRDLHDVMPGGKYFVSEKMYRAACDVYRPQLKKNYADYFHRTGVAAIVFPALTFPPTPIGEAQEVVIAGKKFGFNDAVSHSIAPGSTAGLPGLVLPAGLTAAGLPVAIEFDGPAGSDRELLVLALGLERVLGELPAPKV